MLPPSLPAPRFVSPADFSAALLRRQNNSHKGDFGSAGLIGGAPSMGGALLLAARSALLQGCGRVFASFIDPAAPSIDIHTPELMFRPLDALWNAPLTALAIGPGLGLSELAKSALSACIASPLPLVLDADALNLLAEHPVLLSHAKRRTAPTVMTPHPAEAARLLNGSTDAVQHDRQGACAELVNKTGATVVLKGAQSVIGHQSTQQTIELWMNPTGNPGMATAGMGDVLTGMICALLAQGVPSDQAALAGAYLHGLAADEGVEQGLGPIGLTASEVAAQARLVRNRLVRETVQNR